MTVAAVDGDPPFPLAHNPCVTFDPSDACYEKESNPFDDWFLFDDDNLGTDGYGATTVEDLNCRINNHHDPPQPQCRHSTTYVPIELPPPRIDLKKLTDDIRRMCESFASPDPFYLHNNDTIITTLTTTTTAAPCQVTPHQVVTSTCSDTFARCTSPITDATIPSPNETPLLKTITPTIPIDDDDDAPTTLKTTTPGHTATIADDNNEMTTQPHDSTTHPHPTLDLEHPRTPYAHPIRPWLSDSHSLVHQALDRLENAIADMSNAVADLSARIETVLSTPPKPPRRFTLPSNDIQQPTSQQLPIGPLPSNRSCNLLPLPAPKPPFTNKKKLVTMHTQPHPSPSFQAMLLRMAKHNYCPP